MRGGTEAMIVDLFAGGGGVSIGIRAALGRSPHIAVNHWPLAIEVHKANHPETRHYVANVYRIRPEEAVGEGPVSLLWASPDCTSHSVAKGAVPVQQKLRMLPYSVIPWAAKVRPEVIIVENVRELRKWGPLVKGKDGKKRPDKEREGETFRAWVRKLEKLGYVVEHRVLTACDYGSPTRRKRLFVVARRDGKPIVWPSRTHGSPEECALNPRLKPFRTAAECIDWSIPCPSIFDRKRPLKPKTLRRIFLGLKRFVLEAKEPYVVPFVVGCGGRAAQSSPTGAGEPLGTVTAKNDRGVVVPVLTRYNGAKSGEFRGQVPGEPISTLDASNRFGLLAPHLVKVNHGGEGREEARGEQIDLPLSTVTASRRGHGLVTAHLASTGGPSGQAHPAPLDAPMGTVLAENHRALVTAFLAKNYGGVVGVPFDGRPLDTVTAVDHHALATAALVKLRGECSGADPSEPMPTLTASGTHVAEVRAFLVAYYGQDAQPGQMLGEPMRTITAKARLGIVTVHGVEYQVVDIGFRMLRSHELLRATCGDYADEFDLSPAKTEADRVRLVGNMVPPHLAAAVVSANVRPPRRRRAAA